MRNLAESDQINLEKGDQKKCCLKGKHEIQNNSAVESERIGRNTKDMHG